MRFLTDWIHQAGCSKSTGVDMYAEPEAALAAVGLEA